MPSTEGGCWISVAAGMLASAGVSSCALSTRCMTREAEPVEECARGGGRVFLGGDKESPRFRTFGVRAERRTAVLELSRETGLSLTNEWLPSACSSSGSVAEVASTTRGSRMAGLPAGVGDDPRGGEACMEESGEDGPASVEGRTSGNSATETVLGPASGPDIADTVPKTSSSAGSNDFFGGRPRRLGAGVCEDGPPAALADAPPCSLEFATCFGGRPLFLATDGVAETDSASPAAEELTTTAFLGGRPLFFFGGGSSVPSSTAATPSCPTSSSSSLFRFLPFLMDAGVPSAAADFRGRPFLIDPSGRIGLTRFFCFPFVEVEGVSRFVTVSLPTCATRSASPS